MRRKGLGGGRDWEEEGIGRKRRDGRRVDGIREDGMAKTGRSDLDDGKAGS